MPVISQIDFTGLWRALPYVENVSYTWVDTNDADINLTLEAVVLTNRSKSERKPSYGKYVQHSRTFKIPSEVWLAAQTERAFNSGFGGGFGGSSTAQDLGIWPKSRDLIVIGNETWMVSTTVDGTLDHSLFRLDCNRLEIVDPLRDTATIYRPVKQDDPYGSRVISKDFTMVGPGDMAVAIEPMSTTRQETGERLFLKNQYDIYLSEEVGVQEGDLVVSGTDCYRVDSWSGKQRLDELMCLHCTTTDIPNQLYQNA